MKKFNFYLLSIVFITFFGCETNQSEKFLLVNETNTPQVEFAQAEIEAAITLVNKQLIDYSNDTTSVYTIVLKIDKGLPPEAYKIKQEANSIEIIGGDATGAMYAGLELADMIKLEKDLSKIGTIENEPYVKKRGLRHNIPLDCRTPSYDDTGDAAQQNIATMWEWEYWQNYLDNMARNRYNVLSFWNLHPYPSWVKVPEYPDVALENVCTYNGDVTRQTDMKWKGEDIYNAEKQTIIKEMTIEEKMDFWKKVFSYAADRGVEIYLFHWNVFVSGTQGKYGITWSQDNDVTIDYIRKSVKAMLLTYPNIKGIGVTAGEHVNRKLQGTDYSIEKWMWKSYGQGVMDARAENPDLDVRFIFRRHWSDLDAINEAFKDYGSEIETSFKYSRARMYSSAKPPWFDKIYRSTVEAYGMPCWLNVRNDDIFIFRWGDPEYASEYMHNIPYDLTPGFYMGPDGYVWGREVVSKNAQSPRQFAVEKHWYKFMIWGHTAYNPNLPETYWHEKIAIKFPGVDAVKLYNTWKASSDIISWVDKVHFRQNDAQFAPEGCMDNKYFHDIDKFIYYPEMPEQGVNGIGAFAKGEGIEGDLSPLDVADSLVAAANILVSGAQQLNANGNAELESTLNDLMALGLLGKYYAEKIRASTNVALYRVNGEQSNKDLAIKQATHSVELWKNYAAVASKQYKPTLFARTMDMDWNAIADSTLKDIEIAKNAEHGQKVEYGNNFLWKRDARRF